MTVKAKLISAFGALALLVAVVAGAMRIADVDGCAFIGCPEENRACHTQMRTLVNGPVGAGSRDGGGGRPAAGVRQCRRPDER